MDSYVISDSEEEECNKEKIHCKRKNNESEGVTLFIDNTDTSREKTPVKNSPKLNTLITEEDIRRKIKEHIPHFSDEESIDADDEPKPILNGSGTSVISIDEETDNNNLPGVHMSENHEGQQQTEVTIKCPDHKEDNDTMNSNLQSYDLTMSDSESDCEILSVSLPLEVIIGNDTDSETAQKRHFPDSENKELQGELTEDAKETGKQLEDLEDGLEGNFEELLPTSSTPDSLDVDVFAGASSSVNDRLRALHDSLQTRPSEQEKAQDPLGLTVKLMPHQKHALAWLLWREQQKPPGGILADDMGLGKTLTMIALIMASNSKDSDTSSSDCPRWGRPPRCKGGTLVVCPASLLAQWEKEIRDKCKRNTLTVTIYHGWNRVTAAKILSRYDVVLTTYHTLAREYGKGSTYSIDWERIILDEAHIIRNDKTQLSASVCETSAKKRWALTGTPIQNKMMDLYAIMKFIKCSPFDEKRVWKRWIEKKDCVSSKRLATVMNSIMLRRTKDELQAKGEMKSLPMKYVEEILVTLDPPEMLVYTKVLVYSRTLFAQFLIQKGERGGLNCRELYKRYKSMKFTRTQQQLLRDNADVKCHEILVLLLRLRQICVHPSLIHSMLDQEDVQSSGMTDADDFDPRFLSDINDINLTDDVITETEEEIFKDQRLTTNLLTADNPVFKAERISSKMKMVLDKVREILAKREKIVIVSQWVSTLELLAAHLDRINYATYSMFTGNLQIKERQGVVDLFNHPTDGPEILLLSLTAGGIGLNLTRGNHLILVDIHWNPQLEMQAQDRVYRYGQTKDVHVYKFICKDTIEEKIKALQESKLNLAQNALSGDVTTKLTLTDLKNIFGF